jgi:hypothetical protein
MKEAAWSLFFSLTHTLIEIDAMQTYGMGSIKGGIAFFMGTSRAVTIQHTDDTTIRRDATNMDSDLMVKKGIFFAEDRTIGISCRSSRRERPKTNASVLFPTFALFHSLVNYTEKEEKRRLLFYSAAFLMSSSLYRVTRAHIGNLVPSFLYSTHRFLHRRSGWRKGKVRRRNFNACRYRDYQ